MWWKWVIGYAIGSLCCFSGIIWGREDPRYTPTSMAVAVSVVWPIVIVMGAVKLMWEIILTRSR